MGFKVRHETMPLTLSPPWEEVEVVCRDKVSLNAFLRLQRAAAAEGDLEVLHEALTEFGDTVLQKWNLVDEDDAPIEASGQSMVELPTDITTAIFSAWLSEVIKIPSPLPEGSPNGKPSLEESAPTAPSLQSPGK